MTDDRRSQSLLMSLAIIAAGVALNFFPSRYIEQLQMLGRDALKPGQMFVLRTCDHLSDSPNHSPDNSTPLATTSPDNEALWQLRAKLAFYQNQNEQLRQEAADHVQVQSSTPLFLPTGIEARVLTAAQKQELQSSFTVNRGGDAQLKELDLVVSETETTIDIGRDHDVPADSFVIVGGTVVGSIKNVGYWSSSVRRITDPDFRTAARLLRCVGDDCFFGATGSLHGQGQERCKLEYVQADQSVEVGDLVVTSAANGFISRLGVVSEANLPPGAESWEIVVEPAFPHDSTLPSQIIVLKEAASSKRLLTN